MTPGSNGSNRGTTKSWTCGAFRYTVSLFTGLT